MKLGRNDPCPCGSGKKYKHCCIDSVSKQCAEMFDDLEQTIQMSPDLTLDEINVVAQQRMQERNNRPNADFCGLSPTLMYNWLHAPLDQKAGVTINIPEDLSGSPVMRYLDLILNEAMQNDGSFKATSKGNLPMKLAQQASGLYQEFAVSRYPTHISISDFAGSNEDKFSALHYSRILAEISGILYRKKGHYHVKKTAQKQYQTHGVKVFFMPMLEAAISHYNWGYLDALEVEIDFRAFWLFMLWRLQCHGSIDQLIEEVCIAFPDLARQFPTQGNRHPQQLLSITIELRFIERFLEYWGFVTVDPRRYVGEENQPRKVDILPLLKYTFQFAV